MAISKIEHFFIELRTNHIGILTDIISGKFAINEFEVNQSIYSGCPFLEGTLEALIINDPFLIEGMIIVSDEKEYNVDVELLKTEKEVSVLVHNRTNVYKYAAQLNQNRNDLFFLKRELHEKNIELDRLRKIADKANEEKSRFLAMMSHEVRNPLNVILGYTELINEEEVSKNVKEHLKYLTISGKNLKVIVDDILDLSRVEAGKLQLSNTPVNLTLLVEQLRNNYKSSHRDLDISLEFSCSKKLPKFVFGDDVRLLQILTNLINNSIKFTQKGAVTTQVNVISSDKKNVKISFKVTDTGRGMTESQAATVFEEYQQNELNDNRVHKGAGLGLAIVKRLVSAMNGTISVSSKIDVGTVFQVDIPFQIDDSIIVNENLEEVLDKNYINGSKILVADDNFLNRTIVAHILNKEKANLTLVKDGIEALSELQKEKFNLVLLDINMPNLSGTSLVKQKETYREFNSETPILALTGNSSVEDVKGYLKIGFKGVIPKPFTSTQFVEILNNNLKN
ncbi:two-component system, chemotaxis family, CheB/CheR fusion protein [Polaribacter sp. KT25b]|uniref:ATP-binding response regulator n=1 Tax=Polaribacter sp. KT25b TaxID=1855336 RepID=UPI00087BAD94|nr:ATP-binding protein [Polaribacter sp. KT25b]SDR82430.1 two-component system, chemotaxis family, CheB/CheR fusion protein [Polaribacter sp. KT25b]